MFRVQIKPSDPVGLEWAEDGSALTITITAEDADFHLSKGLDRITVSAEVPRKTALWIWKNIDRQLIRELFIAQTTGDIGERMAEVARIIDDEPDDH